MDSFSWTDTDNSTEIAEPASDCKDAVFRRDLIELIPHLRAFSRSLCGDATLADDVVQDSLVKAWAARDQYKHGTNLKAWAFTILRNQFYSMKRRSWRQCSLDPEIAESTLVSVNTPVSAVELNELRQAMGDLPDSQREAIVLVGAGGFTYKEAGEICGVATGTIKSRVCRARATLVDVYKNGSCTSEQDDVGALDAMQSFKSEIDEIVAASDAATILK